MSALEIGQKVLIHDTDEAFFDAGRILDIKHDEHKPDTPKQIAVRSDFLDGEEVIFRFSHGTDKWVRVFQNPLGNPGDLVLSQHEPPYIIIGVEG